MCNSAVLHTKIIIEPMCSASGFNTPDSIFKDSTKF
jgi:hypothetical protein